MRVLITADGPTLQSSVDARFARAPFFLIADTRSHEIETRDNSTNVNASQGAGVSAAQSAIDAGVEAIISGRVGPKAAQALRAGNISVYQAENMSAGDALAALEQGQLRQADL